MTLLLVACAVVLLPVLPCRADELTIGVVTEPFLEGIGAPQPQSVTLGTFGVAYNFGRTSKPLTSLRIGVHASVAEAEAIFQEAEKHRSGTRPPPLTGNEPGDLFRCSDLDAGPGTLRFRRGNVLVEVSWNGDRASAVKLTRTTDDMLVQRDDICPKGPVVPIPNVEITGPARVALNPNPKVLSTGQVRYRSTDAMLLRTEYQPVLHLEGSVDFAARELGKREVTLQFATSRNVVFAKTYAFEVVPPEELLTENSVTPWTRWAGERLYFVRDPQQDWTAVPHAEKEWFNLDHGTFSRIDPPQAWQQRALNDLTRALNPRWLPALDMLEVRKDIGTPALRKVYYAAFHTRGCGVICMGVIGQQVLVYIEQPTPLPEGQEEVRPEDVLAADWLGEATDEGGETIYPRLQVMTRSLDRYRGYRAEGPFEPVRILLVDVRFPARTNLEFPGYR